MLMTSPRIITSLCSISLFFSSVLLINAQTTAYDALEAFSKSRGRADLERVVGVTGINGQDQPKRWLVLMKDVSVKNLMHEYAMEKSKVVGERHFSLTTEQKLPSVVLPLTQLNIDSDKAFKTANQAANSGRVGFDSISYLLRIHSSNSPPVWTLTLTDQQKKTVGTLLISASTGKLLSKIWYRPGTPDYTQVNSRSATDDIKELWTRGVDSVSRGFQKLDKKIGEKLNRNKSTVNPAPSSN